ncbi:UNVERIFIED_CONTAM: Transposon Ty1-BL Gag-Pol polyprotein [Sesamum radiatum]|uniref:Transposon Ty1-BL Gag-Pol polyprotein n=1 Tax=Sesamum radiatum TaxID=300843 RepID=A0AAW2VN80_SESRA
MTKKPFVGQSEIANGLLDLVHTDICGPLSSPARGGFSYFITFTDDHSRYGYVYLMRYKSEAFGRFKEYRLEVEKQTSSKIKAIRSDRGGEYLSGEFIDYLKDNRIISQWTHARPPQLNGVVERRNQTLLDIVRSMMSFTKLTPSFWGHALETAAKLLNIAPSKMVLKTPY